MDVDLHRFSAWFYIWATGYLLRSLPCLLEVIYKIYREAKESKK